jgi:hypothetical protein
LLVESISSTLLVFCLAPVLFASLEHLLWIPPADKHQHKIKTMQYLLNHQSTINEKKLNMHTINLTSTNTCAYMRRSPANILGAKTWVFHHHQ